MTVIVFQVFWWHNGIKIPFDGMTYTFNMKVSDIGKYTCYAKNRYGSETRHYEISSTGKVSFITLLWSFKNLLNINNNDYYF